MKARIMPMRKIPPQNASPSRDCYLDWPLTITLMTKPSKNPEKLPIAKRSPAAEPSPTGNTSSHPSSNMIGTSGIRKNEFNIEIKLAHQIEYVCSSG